MQVAAQRAEDIGFEQMNHDRVERSQLVQDGQGLLDDARAHEQRLGEETQPAPACQEVCSERPGPI